MIFAAGSVGVPGVQQGVGDHGLGAGALLRPPPRHPRLLPHPLLRPRQAEPRHLHHPQVDTSVKILEIFFLNLVVNLIRDGGEVWFKTVFNEILHFVKSNYYSSMILTSIHINMLNICPQSCQN